MVAVAVFEGVFEGVFVGVLVGSIIVRMYVLETVLAFPTASVAAPDAIVIETVPADEPLTTSNV